MPCLVLYVLCDIKQGERRAFDEPPVDRREF